MSEKQRFPRAAALEVARDLVRHLEPVTTKLIVAGSLRRRKMDVGDVEIVYIPRTVERPIDLVTTAPVDLAAECLERLIDQGLLAKRKNTKGSTMWGQMNKLAVHVAHPRTGRLQSEPLTRAGIGSPTAWAFDARTATFTR